MSKPTNIRLDDTTRARAEAVKARAQVPVTTSAVLQEAIRRGLDEMERERPLPTGAVAPFHRVKFLGWTSIYPGECRAAFGGLLGVCTQQRDGCWEGAVFCDGADTGGRTMGLEKVACMDRTAALMWNMAAGLDRSIDLGEFLNPGGLGDTELKFREG